MVTIYIRTYDENIKDENDENKNPDLKTQEKEEDHNYKVKNVTKNKDIALKIFTKKNKNKRTFKRTDQSSKSVQYN